MRLLARLALAAHQVAEGDSAMMSFTSELPEPLAPATHTNAGGFRQCS
jgi:hypothetical protein